MRMTGLGEGEWTGNNLMKTSQDAGYDTTAVTTSACTSITVSRTLPEDGMNMISDGSMNGNVMFGFTMNPNLRSAPAT